MERGGILKWMLRVNLFSRTTWTSVEIITQALDKIKQLKNNFLISQQKHIL